MKVLLCNKFYRPLGGPETVVLDTVRELKALGHTPIPFSMEHPDNLESEYSAYFVSNVDYNTKQSRGGRLIREAVNLLYSREAKRNIRRLIADTRPDIAHAHNIYHQLSPSILTALRGAGIPTVLTLHDSKLLCANMLFLTHGRICEKCRGRRFHHAVLNKCVKDSIASSLLCCVEETIHRWTAIYEKNVDLFLTPSRFLKDKLVQHGRLDADRIEVLPNYADTRTIVPSCGPGSFGLFIGRIEPLKGVMTLLKACSRIPDFEIRLAGKGPLLEEGERFCREHGLTKVKFVGFLGRDELTGMLRECGFVVLPSECYENCPMTVLEAHASGKPVVASRIGGIPELVSHESDGLLFEPGDADALGAAMRRLIEDPDAAVEMGRKGRAKVERSYSIDAYMKSLLAIYDRVLKR